MADKSLTIRLQVQNFLKAGFSEAKSSLGSFAKSVGSNMTNIWAGFTMLKGAVQSLSGVLGKMWSEYASKEKSELDFGEAIRLSGESVEANLPKYKALSEQMMKETGVGHDVYLQRMANMKLMGLSTDQLESATKAVTGMVRAGMGEEQAQKAVVAAFNGNTEALTRYIPALRTATSDQEKAALAAEYMGKQWEMQKKQMDTAVGSIENLKTWLGEIFEDMGNTIFSTDLFKTSVQDLTKSIQDLLSSGQIAVWANNIVDGFKTAMESGKAFLGILKEVYKYSGASDQMGVIKAISRGAGAIAGGAGLKDALAQASSGMAEGFYGSKINEMMGDPFGGAELNKQAEEAKRIRDEAIKTNAAQAETEKAIEEESLQAQLQRQMEEKAIENGIAEENRLGLEAEEEMRKEALKKAEKDADDKLKAQKKAADDLVKAKEDEIKLKQDIEDNAADEQKRKWEEQLAEKGRIAKITVQEFIDEAQKEKEALQLRNDEDKKAKRLMNNARGDMKNLSKKDREWMEKFNEIRDAGKIAKDAKDNLMQVEATRQTTILSAIQTALAKNQETLNKLLVGG